MDLRIGLKASIVVTVSDDMTAAALGSGRVAGLATPTMIALMEAAAIEAVEHGLPKGFSTVGTQVNVSHLAPTPVGMVVTARAVLEQVDGRRLRFAISADDEAGSIGRGTHERVIIELARLEERLRTRVAGDQPPKGGG